MSFLSRLFGKGGSSTSAGNQAEPKVTGQTDYAGYVIKAMPFKQEGQFQTCGVIEKEIDGVLKSYRFIRADRSTMVEDVTDLALQKGRSIIDEQGDAIFKE